jgi:hypothetical protein
VTSCNQEEGKMKVSWFDVAEISRLSGPFGQEKLDHLDDWNSLAVSLILTINIDIGSNCKVKVDALPLLYELLNALSNGIKNGFEVQIGEGLWLSGSGTCDDVLRVKVEFVAGGSESIIGEIAIKYDELLLDFSTCITNIVTLIERSGLDVACTLKKFQLSKYQR